MGAERPELDRTSARQGGGTAAALQDSDAGGAAVGGEGGRGKWQLDSLGRGAYCRAGTRPSVGAAVAVLSEQLGGPVHLGGRTALAGGEIEVAIHRKYATAHSR